MPNDSVIKPMHPMFAYPELTQQLITKLTSPVPPTEAEKQAVITATKWAASGATALFGLFTFILAKELPSRKKNYKSRVKYLKAYNKQARAGRKLHGTGKYRGTTYGPKAPLSMMYEDGAFRNFALPDRPMSFGSHLLATLFFSFLTVGSLHTVFHPSDPLDSLIKKISGGSK